MAVCSAARERGRERERQETETESLIKRPPRTREGSTTSLCWSSKLKKILEKKALVGINFCIADKNVERKPMKIHRSEVTLMGSIEPGGCKDLAARQAE